MTKQRSHFACDYLQTAQEVTKSFDTQSQSQQNQLCYLSTQIVSFSQHLCSRRDARGDKLMPRERLLGKATGKIQIYLHGTKRKIFTFSSDY